MSEQHTPEPWVEGKAGGAIVSTDPEIVAEQRGLLGDDHLTFYGGAVICESVQDKNMPIIIAAPAMLKALKHALPIFVGLVNTMGLEPGKIGYRTGAYVVMEEVRDLVRTLGQEPAS